jgi:diguanylate cyclase (GGDEF)-like protein
MTLRRQLFWAISLLFMAVLVGLLVLNVRGTRDYLEQQLGSHAQDTATSLSMRLGQVMGKGDAVLTQLQIDSVFDRGYFQRVVLLDARETVLVNRELPSKVGDVPLWFSTLFPLRAPGGEAFVSSGWQQLGKVVVVSQPAHAYAYLWSSFLELSAWVALVFAVALLMTHGLLKIILNPLHAIERTARAVQDKRFEQIEQKPRARELARVVRAMNDMSRRIAEIIDAEVRRADEFRQQVMVDEVTQLDNRKGFDLRFASMLQHPDAGAQGYLLGIEVNGLKEFNTDVSYQQGNDLLRQVARIGKTVNSAADDLAARLGGATFVFVCTQPERSLVLGVAEKVRTELAAVFQSIDPEHRMSFSMGLVPIDVQQTKGDLLARLDMVLEAARVAGRNALHAAPEEADRMDVLGSQGWRDLIESALQENRWSLVGQAVVRFGSGNVLHTEVMARLVDKLGQQVPASRFVPMATRHKLMSALDRSVLTMARAHAETQPGAPDVAVNVSTQSVVDPAFMAWLASFLKDMGPLASRLSLELTGYGCSQNIEAARAFAQLLRKHGVKFGIDRLGLDPNSPSVIRALPPDYVKLDSPLIMATQGDQVAVEWMQTMVSLAKSLDATVIAQGIESADDFALLAQTHDAGQGYHIGKPEPL